MQGRQKMKLIVSVITLGLLVVFAVSASDLGGRASGEDRVLLSDGLLTAADLAEIERRIEALPRSAAPVSVAAKH